MTGWSTQRPGQDKYREAHANIGKYYSGSQGRPYINPDVPMYVPNDGECAIRIVDPIELLELEVYFFDVHFHREVGFRKDYFLCLLRHNLGPCAVCENATSDLWEQDKDAAKSYLPDQRRLMWVLDLKKPAEANMLKLWSCPKTLSDEILAQSRDPEMDIIREVSHPLEGVPVYFMRTGKGRNTKYSGVKLGTRPMPLGEDIANQRFRFMDILIVPTYEEVYASQNMQDLPAEASPEAPPVSAYEQDYALSPAQEMGAQAAAQAYQESPTTGAGPAGQIDYSDYDRIDPNNRECFRSKFNEYNECDSCTDRAMCSQPWPVKPVKTSRPPVSSGGKTPKPSGGSMGGGGDAPSRVQRPDPISRPTSHPGAQNAAGGYVQRPGGASPAGTTTTNLQAPDNAQKIQSAQEKLRADIARRQAQNR